MNTRLLVVAALTIGLAASPALAAGKRKPARNAKPARAAAAPAISPEKPIKRLIGAVRYKKDAMAVAQLDGDAQARFLLDKSYESSSPAQRAEFIKLFHGLFSTIAFPRIRKNFEKLDTVLYDKATIAGDRATVGCTIVILHPMKKQEIRATYDMRQVDGKWLVVDVTVKGDRSMLTNIRKDQIGPILAEGGMPKLLDLLRKRLAR